MDIHSATNVTVLNCVTCDWEWSKDQSVKISGALVRFAAEAMYKHEGYSGLGEFVRDALRKEDAMRYSLILGCLTKGVGRRRKIVIELSVEIIYSSLEE